MSNKNVELVKKVFDGMNHNNVPAMIESFHHDFVNHSFQEPVIGIEAFKNLFSIFTSGFPDMTVKIEDIIADDDKVVTRGYWTGTHKGEFMKIPATGKKINVNYIDIWKISDGKLKENWVQMDIAGLMRQLGIQ